MILVRDARGPRRASLVERLAITCVLQPAPTPLWLLHARRDAARSIIFSPKNQDRTK